MVYKINNYSLNYVVNLGEQYLTKEMKKILEQADKLMKSEIMQKRFQRDSALIEAWENSGYKSQFELLQKQIALVSPQFFPNLKERVTEVTEAISEPDTTPKDATKEIEALNNELRNAFYLIKKLRKEKKTIKTEAIAIRNNKPENKREMMAVIDRNRKLNNKCNNEACGRELGWDGETIKGWILEFGLSDYAYNPERLEAFHRKKK